MKSKLKTI
jgi:redox-sensitive bicupin YhaK (pirin superfamily)